MCIRMRVLESVSNSSSLIMSDTIKYQDIYVVYDNNLFF